MAHLLLIELVSSFRPMADSLVPNERGGQAMYPKTLYGWYNKLVRGHPYNEKTAYILDYTFKPSTRLLSILEDRNRRIKAFALKSKKTPSFAFFTALKF